MDFKGLTPSFSTRWKRPAASESFQELSAACCSSLSQELRKKADPRLSRWLPVLQSMSQEPNAEFVGEGLLSVGDQLRKEGYLDLAASFYSAGKSIGGKNISRAAEEKLKILAGEGPFGMRCEFLASRLFQETNIAAIAPMWGTSVVGKVVGTAIFGGLARVPCAAWWSRGVIAEFLAGLGSYAVELPLFVGMNSLLASHPETSSADWKHAAPLLGVMKLFNAAGALPIARPLNRLPAFWRSQGGIFLSLLATRQLEDHLELHPHLENDSWGDVLIEAIGMGLGAHLGSQLFGPAFAKFALSFKVRASSSPHPTFFKMPDLRGEGALVVEGLATMRAKSPPSRLGENFFMVKSGSGGSRAAPGGKHPITVEEKRQAYRQFAETAHINLETWLGRVLKKNRAPLAKIEETIDILWGDLPPSKKALEEMDWIEMQRIRGAIPRLRAQLQNSNRDHRIRALQALTTLKAPKPLPELVDLLYPYLDNRLELSQSQVFEIEAILHAMTVLGVPENLLDLGRPYLALLRGHHHREVSTAAEAASLQLGLIPHVPDYQPMLMSASQLLRLSALNILKATHQLPGSKAHHLQVVERLRDTDPKVRILAAETLARSGHKNDIVLLGKMMRTDGDRKVRRAAADLLAKLRSPVAYTDLFEVLQNISTPPIVQEGALNALGKLGKMRARAALDQLKFFSLDPKPELRIAAAIALAHCGEIDAAIPIFRERFAAVHYITQHLQILDGIAGLRKEIGQALAKKLAQEPVHPLIAIAGDPNPNLAAPAVRVLDAFQKGWDGNLLRLWEQIK